MNIKKYIILLASISVATFCLNAAEKAPKKTDAQLRAEYMQKDLATLKDLGEPKLSNRNASTIVLFGDTQTYTPRMKNQPILELMTAWVATNQKRLNIKGLLHLGDIVEHNAVLNTPHGSDQNGKQMWEWVSHCFKRLDGRIPYFLCTGNHDYGGMWYQGQAAKGTSYFTEYFNPARNYKNQEALLKVYAPRNVREEMDNVFYQLEIGGKWGTVYVLALEFDPRKEVIEWAAKLLENYKDKCVFLITHMYINTEAEISCKNLWEGLVKKSPAIKLVLNGHHCYHVTDFEQTTAFREDVKDDGKKVKCMLFDSQTVGGGFGGNGGDGWLRLLELQPDGKTIKVSTYSPLFGVSPMTKRLAWRTAPYDMFTFELDK